MTTGTCCFRVVGRVTPDIQEERLAVILDCILFAVALSYHLSTSQTAHTRIHSLKGALSSKRMHTTAVQDSKMRLVFTLAERDNDTGVA